MRTEDGSRKSQTPEVDINSFDLVDKAICRFLVAVYRERSQWISAQTELPKAWKHLYDYEQMYSEVSGCDELFI